MLMTKRRTKPLGKRLLALRQRLGTDGRPITQKEAADLLGVSLRAWHYWELGERDPLPIHLRAIEELENRE